MPAVMPLPNGANISVHDIVSQGAGRLVLHDGGLVLGLEDAKNMVATGNRVKVKLPGGRAMLLGK
jgi:hypothetical protein